jgi:phage/plasmid-like protein (TIGR03299 family)
MAHEIDMTHGRANIAFIGSRNDVWHKLGTEMAPGMSLDEWKRLAGLDWHTVKTPAFHQLPATGEFVRVPGWCYQSRSDTLAPLGYTSEASYKSHQPGDLLEFVYRYTEVDDRFVMDVAGSLNGGGRIWATARFNGDIDVAGSKHVARLLASTSYDTTTATWARGCMTRAVCSNTLAAAFGEKAPAIRVAHSKHFDKVQAGRDLAAVAQSFEQFKQIGDALGVVAMADTEVSAMFKKLLDIPHDAKKDDLSTRKWNQFCELRSAYSRTVAEGTERGTAWTALNAITRYVDHDRSSRNGDSPESARFASAQWGSGAAMKAEAWALLMPMIKDRVAA